MGRPKSKYPKVEASLPPTFLASIDRDIANLRINTAYYLETIQAIMDGVTLGAEQVQDKRLENLEKGETTTVSSLFLIFALTLILEGTIGPAIAAIMIKYTLTPMLKATSWALKLNAEEKIKGMLNQVSILGKRAMRENGLTSAERVRLILQADTLNNLAELLKKDINKKWDSAPLIQELSKLVNFVEANLVAGTKSAAAAEKAGSAQGKQRTENSSGVQISADAMATCSKLRLNLIFIQESFEAYFKQPRVSESDRKIILDIFDPPGLIEIEQLRYNLQLSTEAIIWGALLINNIDKDIIQNRIKKTSEIPQNSEFVYTQDDHSPMKINASENIRRYLLIRFAGEVERWAKSTNIWAGDNSGWRRPNWKEEQPENVREDLLVAYLATIKNKLPKNLIELKGATN
jgi:hypothetical protein